MFNAMSSVAEVIVGHSRVSPAGRALSLKTFEASSCCSQESYAMCDRLTRQTGRLVKLVIIQVHSD